jgi:hypothetical protein
MLEAEHCGMKEIMPEKSLRGTKIKERERECQRDRQGRDRERGR